MRDLSSLARDSMWVTSQEGGNLVHDNSPAMTAKGSPPATPVPAIEAQSDPRVSDSDNVPVGTDSDRKVHGSFSPSSASWKVVTDG